MIIVDPRKEEEIRKVENLITRQLTGRTVNRVARAIEHIDDTKKIIELSGIALSYLGFRRDRDAFALFIPEKEYICVTSENAPGYHSCSLFRRGGFVTERWVLGSHEHESGLKPIFCFEGIQYHKSPNGGTLNQPLVRKIFRKEDFIKYVQLEKERLY